MNLQDFFRKYLNKGFDNVKEMTLVFNELSVVERKVFLNELTETEYKSLGGWRFTNA
jgi:hypothetical protein